MNYNLGYNTVHSVCGSRHSATYSENLSQCVSPEGFEPSTYSLKGSHSTAELWALKNSCQNFLVTPVGIGPTISGMKTQRPSH